MSIYNIPCYPADKEMFKANDPADDEGRTSTTFYQDFKIAERFGTKAVKDTFNKAFKEWKRDIGYMTELAVVTNHLGWEHYNKGERAFANLYFGWYHEVCAYVEQADDEGNNAGPFTDEEVCHFARVLD